MHVTGSFIKTGVAAILVLFGCRTSPAQNSWVHAIGGSQTDLGASVQPTADGGYILLGTTNPVGGAASDVSVVKFASDGQVAWQGTYGYAKTSDLAICIQQTAGPGFIAGAWTNPYGDLDPLVLKLGATGDVEWQYRYGHDTGAGENDTLRWIEPTGDGGSVFVGEGIFAGSGWDAIVVKLNSSGFVTWQKRFGGTGSDSATCVRSVAGGGYIVAGSTESFGAKKSDAWVVRLDANGNILWQKRYGGGLDDKARSACQLSDGTFVVVGSSTSFADSSKGLLLRLDANGGIMSAEIHGGTGSDELQAVSVTADGGYMITGTTSSFGGGNHDGWIVKGGGAAQWQRTYGGTAEEMLLDGRQAPDGGFVIAGITTTYGAGSSDMLVVRTEVAGDLAGGCSIDQAPASQGSSVPMTVASTTAQAIAGPFVRYLPNAISSPVALNVAVVCSSVCPQIELDPPTLPEGFQSVPYQQFLSAAGGNAPYTYSVASGALPPGLTLTPDGDLSGVPLVVGTYAFSLGATDVDNCTGLKSHTLQILPPAGSGPTITKIKSKSSKPGSTANIIGAGFSKKKAEDHAYFGALEAKIKQATPTKLKLKIPKGLTKGVVDVHVVVNGVPSATVSFEVK
ncbi:MAG: IPT/TIG domain-containing protein [Acidobacteria bacterium]|nr:IPT/TIG domain-containing protein [Acidobacteriota bacterium]